jgi:hypothetical protein
VGQAQPIRGAVSLLQWTFPNVLAEHPGKPDFRCFKDGAGDTRRFRLQLVGEIGGTLLALRPQQPRQPRLRRYGSRLDDLEYLVEYGFIQNRDAQHSGFELPKLPAMLVAQPAPAPEGIVGLRR